MREAITFRHENGSEVPGYITGPGVGPMAHIYATVHVTPETMIAFGLDRETRHRKTGMDRQVLLSRINREAKE